MFSSSSSATRATLVLAICALSAVALSANGRTKCYFGEHHDEDVFGRGRAEFADFMIRECELGEHCFKWECKRYVGLHKWTHVTKKGCARPSNGSMCEEASARCTKMGMNLVACASCADGDFCNRASPGRVHWLNVVLMSAIFVLVFISVWHSM